MTQTQQFDADVIATEPESAGVDGLLNCKFQGSAFIGQRTPILAKLQMTDAGYELDFDFAMEVRNSQFTSPKRPPANTEVIEIGAMEYRIVATSPDQFGVVTHYAVKQNT